MTRISCVLLLILAIQTASQLVWKWPYENVFDIRSQWNDLYKDSVRQYTFPINVAHKKQFFITATIDVQTGAKSCTGNCSVNFSFSLDKYNITERNSGLLTGSFIRPSPLCKVPLNDTNTTIRCFDFIKIPVEIITRAQNTRGGNLTVVGRVSSPQGKQDLSSLQLSVHINVLAVPYVFDKWASTGVNKSQVECFWEETVIKPAEPAIIMKFGLLNIANHGKNVAIQYIPDDRMLHDFKSSMGYRIRAMQLGITEAVKATMTKYRLQSFPDVTAIIYVGDEAHYSIPKDLPANCRPGPILAQNRIYTASNPFVVVPDFSYFTHFWDRHDHGTAADKWFELIERERILSERKLYSKLTYGKQRFELKKPAAIYRGRISSRRMGPLRAAIAECKLSDNRLNATAAQYVSRVDMCNDFQAVISVPGNGVWSWATKYNMFCNSISILVTPEELKGETWETRMAIGFRPWIHYLPISANPKLVCRDLDTLTTWIRNNPDEAKQMALRSRDFVFRKLGQQNVLLDLGRILMDLSSLQSRSSGNQRLK